MDAWRLSKLMGHASIANTTKYVRMSPEPLKDAWRGNLTSHHGTHREVHRTIADPIQGFLEKLS